MPEDRTGGGNRTGEVTSWTRCLSSLHVSHFHLDVRCPACCTDIEQDGPVISFVNDVSVKDLVVQGTRRTDRSRHG